MAGLGVHLGKNHGPGQTGVGHPAPQFPVDEIADTPRRQAQGHQGSDEIGDGEKGFAVLAAPGGAGDQHPEEAAMEGHASLPHGDNFQGMGKVIGGLVKQHLAQAPSQHHAQHAPEEQVVQLLLAPGGAVTGGLALANAVAAQEVEGDEGHQVHQSVPADRQGAEGEGDGIELGMDQHGGGAARLTKGR